MADQSPQKWAETFAADLILDGERVPFDRVVQRHYHALVEQRTRGLTWKALANVLRRAGVVRENGKAYTADHLRVAFGRMNRAEKNDGPAQRLKGAAQVPSAHIRHQGEPLTSPRAVPRSRETHFRTSATLERHSTPNGDKDVSEDEIGLAIDRIKKLQQ